MILIFQLFGLVSGFSQNAINLWRICNDEGKLDYDITYKLNSACNGSFDSISVWARLDGSTVFEQVDDTFLVTVFGKFTSKTVVGKKDYKAFFLLSNNPCFGAELSSDTVLVDRVEPSPMTIEMATVIDGQVVISWEKNAIVDLSAYELYKVDQQSTSFPVGQVEKDVLFYEIPIDQVDPKKGVATVRIAAIDSCGLKGIPDGTAKTIFFEILKNNPCDNILEVKWSNYVGDNWMADYRRIVVLDENRNEIKDVVLAPGINSIFLNDLPEGLLSIYIEEKKKNSDLITRSNELEINRLAKLVLDSFYIKHVSIENERIDLEWFIEENEVVDAFEVYEIFDGRPEFRNKEVYSASKKIYSFSGDWNGGIESYLIKAIGICGGSLITDTSRNMFLKGEWLDTNKRLLKVSDYTIWHKGVSSYSVERRLANESWVDLGLMTSNEFIDDEFISLLDSGICYRVTAKGREFDSVETAMSNTICMYYPFHGDLPNAFSPIGVNSVFKINAVQYDNGESTMVIFNRWGERVFQSDDPVLNGWNGNLNNEPKQECPTGIYVYHIALKMQNGKRYNYSGTLHLIR